MAVWDREEPVAGRCQAVVELSELLLRRRRPLRLLRRESSASTGGDDDEGEDACDDESMGVEDSEVALRYVRSSSSSCDEGDAGVKSLRRLMGVSTHSMIAYSLAVVASVAGSVCAPAMVSSLSIWPFLAAVVVVVGLLLGLLPLMACLSVLLSSCFVGTLLKSTLS